MRSRRRKKGFHRASATKHFCWFENNYLKADPGRSHILLGTKKPEIVSIDEIPLIAISHQKLLGIKIDSESKLEKSHYRVLSQISTKLNTLCITSSSMSLYNRGTSMKAFIGSQFNYCPLIWMHHSRALYNKINRTHEREFRNLYSDYNCSFNELLDIDGSFTAHEKNAFKVNETIPGDLRMLNELYGRNRKIVRYGRETISSLFQNSGLWHHKNKRF